MSDGKDRGSPRFSVGSDGVGHLIFDSPDRSANVLTEEVLKQLEERISAIRSGCDRGEIRGILVQSAKPSFIVGADIEAIAKIADPNLGAEAARAGQRVFGELESLPIPTVAAIHGTCVGGGTELALACRYRLASDAPETRIGLPEVQLGILPAWGGTTRLPRLIGLRRALDLLLTGKQVDARKAHGLGLVDAVLPHDLFPELALAFLMERIQGGPPISRERRGLVARLLEDTAPGRSIVVRTARRHTLARTGGHYPAPLRILDVVRSSLGRTLEQALEREALAAGELIASDVSKNLIHVFELREATRKRSDTPDPGSVSEIRRVGVVGAGTMGGGIAQLAAYHGIEVRLKDVRQEAISLALHHAASLFDSAADKKRLSKREASRAMGRISGGLTYAGIGPAQLVVEAVVERMEIKQTVLREVESKVARSCVIATNTSSLSVDAMARSLEAPNRFLGMHFFNPVHKMPLIEVVRGRLTSDTAVETVCGLAVRMGKVPVVVRDGPGFLVNRILGPYLNEAGFLLEEGASIESVDGAALAFGMPMGPLRLIDEIGIDIARHVGASLYEALGERLAPAAALVALGESGRLGRKGGSGFYQYRDGGDASPDPSAFIPPLRSEGGSAPSSEAIRDRLVLSMINEAARVLADGVTDSAGDVDLAMIMGTGFPPFRGGLLRFADEIHPRTLVERLRACESTLGARFSPAPLLVELAKDDRSFYESFPVH